MTEKADKIRSSASADMASTRSQKARPLKLFTILMRFLIPTHFRSDG